MFEYILSYPMGIGRLKCFDTFVAQKNCALGKQKVMMFT